MTPPYLMAPPLISNILACMVLRKVFQVFLGCKGHTRYLGIYQTCVVFLAVASVNQSLFIIAG